jgi:hypothetical protein
MAADNSKDALKKIPLLMPNAMEVSPASEPFVHKFLFRVLSRMSSLYWMRPYLY